MHFFVECSRLKDFREFFLFRRILENDAEIIYKYSGGNFEILFAWGSTFIEIMSNGKLVFNY